MEQQISPRPHKITVRKSTGARKNLKFPEDHHLNVTTEKRVHAWYSSGVREAFASRDGGIVTTREAKDGSGILAIADSQIVLLHDARGHTHRRYKLKGKDDQVRLIDFANDSKEIFFSTSLQDSVLRYSITKDRFINFSCTHPSPPTIVAVSPQSVYLLSTARNPPVIYLQDLQSGGTPVHVKPEASDAYVTAAAFHPQREDIFLLAYADSTLSIHNASRIMVNRANGTDGSVGHFRRGHRITNAHIRDSEVKRSSASPGARGIGISAASFISGHNLRVVSVAGDGRCRIVDFEFGLKVLRTWHVQAACTCLSVFTIAETFQKSAETVVEIKSKGDVALKPVAGRLYGHIIAIGRADGFVVLYDDLGLMRGERLLHLKRGPIINVEWIPNEKREPVALERALGLINSATTTEGTCVLAPKAGWATKPEADPDRKQLARSPEHVASRTDTQSSYNAAPAKITGSVAKTDRAITTPPPKGSLLDSLKRSPIKVSPRKLSTAPVIPLPLTKIPSMYFPMPGAWISSSSSLGMMHSIPSVEPIVSQRPEHEMLEQTATSQEETKLVASEKSLEKPKTQAAVQISNDAKHLYSLTPVQPTHASDHLQNSPVWKTRREVTANRPLNDTMRLAEDEPGTSTKRPRAKGKEPMPLQRPSSPSRAQKYPHLHNGVDWVRAPQNQISRTTVRSHNPTPPLVDTMFTPLPSSPPDPVCTPNLEDSLPAKKTSPKLQPTPLVRPTGHTPRRSSDTLPSSQPRYATAIATDSERHPYPPLQLHKTEQRPQNTPAFREALTSFHSPHHSSNPSSSLTTWSQEGPSIISAHSHSNSLDSNTTARPPQPPSQVSQRPGRHPAAAPPSLPKWLPPQLKSLPSPPSPAKPSDDVVAGQNYRHKAGCGCGCAEAVSGELAKMREEVEALREVMVALRREMLGRWVAVEEEEALANVNGRG